MFHCKVFEAAAIIDTSSPQNQQACADLSELRKNLRTDFEKNFGKNAINNYYLGSIKVPEYFKNDVVVFKNAEPLSSVRKEFGAHFPHETLADKLEVAFGGLHIPFLQPCFMAKTLHQYTGNPLYLEIAEDIFEEFKVEAELNRTAIRPKIKQWRYDEVTAGLNYAASLVLQHKKPRSLELSETIDPMSEDENPGPRLD